MDGPEEYKREHRKANEEIVAAVQPKEEDRLKKARVVRAERRETLWLGGKGGDDANPDKEHRRSQHRS